EAGGASGFWVGGACFRGWRPRGQAGRTPRASDGERAYRPLLDMPGSGGDRREQNGRMPADRRCDRRPATVEGDGKKIEPESLLEHFAGQVTRRPQSRMGVSVLARARFHPGDELFDGRRRYGRMHDQHLRRYADEGYRREIALRVEAQLGEQARINHKRTADYEQRVAVGRRPRDERGADIAAAARMVLDVELLAEAIGELRREQARNHVDRASRGERGDHLDRPIRIVGWLCQGWPGEHDREEGKHARFAASILPPQAAAAHSARMFASWTTLLHLAISALMRAPNSSGVLATGPNPRVPSRSLTSAAATALATSARQRSMMSFAVPAGATIPVNVSLSRSGTPASALVGTFGSAGERRTLSTASAHSFSSLMLDMAGGRAVNAIGVWPPIVELIGSGALLNGPVTRSS